MHTSTIYYYSNSKVVRVSDDEFDFIKKNKTGSELSFIVDSLVKYQDLNLNNFLLDFKRNVEDIKLGHTVDEILTFPNGYSINNIDISKEELFKLNHFVTKSNSWNEENFVKGIKLFSGLHQGIAADIFKFANKSFSPPKLSNDFGKYLEFLYLSPLGRFKFISGDNSSSLSISMPAYLTSDKVSFMAELDGGITEVQFDDLNNSYYKPLFVIESEIEFVDFVNANEFSFNATLSFTNISGILMQEFFMKSEAPKIKGINNSMLFSDFNNLLSTDSDDSVEYEKKLDDDYVIVSPRY